MRPDPERHRIVEATRRACIEAALQGYEDASLAGLCREGAWEAAVGAMQRLDPEAPLPGDPFGGEPGATAPRLERAGGEIRSRWSSGG